MASGVQPGSFALPPSPPVKRHFKEVVMEKVEKLFHHKHKDEVDGVDGVNGVNGVNDVNDVNGVNGVNGHAEKMVITSQEGFPRIFEDKAETRTMEVRLISPLWALHIPCITSHCIKHIQNLEA